MKILKNDKDFMLDAQFNLNLICSQKNIIQFLFIHECWRNRPDAGSSLHIYLQLLL